MNFSRITHFGPFLLHILLFVMIWTRARNDDDALVKLILWYYRRLRRWSLHRHVCQSVNINQKIIIIFVNFFTFKLDRTTVLILMVTEKKMKSHWRHSNLIYLPMITSNPMSSNDYSQAWNCYLIGSHLNWLLRPFDWLWALLLSRQHGDRMLIVPRS